MSKINLNIHLETFDDESFDRVINLGKKGPIAVSIAPMQIPQMKKEQIEKLTEILSKKGYILGQQGLNHKCDKCNKYHMQQSGKEVIKLGVDPWHENYCLWLGEIPEQEQERFMIEGRKILEETFGIRPELYVPPNHLLGENTIRIAQKLGYKWITDRALIKIEPYPLDGIIVIPEGEPEIGNNQVYIHADRWRGNLDYIVKKGFVSFYDLKTRKVDKNKILENRKLKMTRKIARDLFKGFRMTEVAAEKAADLIYETRFNHGGFL